MAASAVTSLVFSSSNFAFLLPLAYYDLWAALTLMGRFGSCPNSVRLFWPLGPSTWLGSSFFLFPSQAFLRYSLKARDLSWLVVPTSAQASSCQGGLPCTMHALLTPSFRHCFLTSSRKPWLTRLGILTWSWPSSLHQQAVQEGLSDLHFLVVRRFFHRCCILQGRVHIASACFDVSPSATVRYCQS